MYKSTSKFSQSLLSRGTVFVKQNKIIANKSSKITMKSISTNQLYFDGGCKPNPGQMICCASINDVHVVKNYGYGTNNVAEWNALLLSLIVAKEQNLTDLHLLGDSKLVINQAQGNWKINKDEFLQFKNEFDILSTMFNSIKLEWVPRNKNLAGIHLENNYKS